MKKRLHHLDAVSFIAKLFRDILILFTTALEKNHDGMYCYAAIKILGNESMLPLQRLLRKNRRIR